MPMFPNLFYLLFGEKWPHFENEKKPFSGIYQIRLFWEIFPVKSRKEVQQQTGKVKMGNAMPSSVIFWI